MICIDFAAQADNLVKFLFWTLTQKEIGIDHMNLSDTYLTNQGLQIFYVSVGL